MAKERGISSHYEQVIKSIGEKGHIHDIYVEFLPAVGGRIQSTIPYDKTSLHREFHFDGLGELNQIDIFRQVRKEESDANEEGVNETAFHLTLRRGINKKFFIDRQDMRPCLLKKWHIEHPKIVPVPLSAQISKSKFRILLKTALFEIHMQQKEFASKIGVDEMTISRWVRSKIVPTRQHLEFMIDFFHWDKDYVLNAAFHKPEGFMLSRRGRPRKPLVSKVDANVVQGVTSFESEPEGSPSESKTRGVNGGIKLWQWND